MKIVTLGEIMLRLSTPGNTRFVQSDSFDVVYGGGYIFRSIPVHFPAAY